MARLDPDKLNHSADFPDFVGELIAGVFDAIVDASIRQMEAYIDLLAAVAERFDQFVDRNDDED